MAILCVTCTMYAIHVAWYDVHLSSSVRPYISADGSGVVGMSRLSITPAVHDDDHTGLPNAINRYGGPRVVSMQILHWEMYCCPPVDDLHSASDRRDNVGK